MFYILSAQWPLSLLCLSLCHKLETEACSDKLLRLKNLGSMKKNDSIAFLFIFTYDSSSSWSRPLIKNANCLIKWYVKWYDIVSGLDLYTRFWWARYYYHYIAIFMSSRCKRIWLHRKGHMSWLCNDVRCESLSQWDTCDLISCIIYQCDLTSLTYFCAWWRREEWKVLSIRIDFCLLLDRWRARHMS